MWNKATLQEVQQLLSEQEDSLDPELLEKWRSVRVPQPLVATLDRSGQVEQVFYVARKGDEVLYYEDVEDGWNHSKISADGVLLEPGYEQDDLKVALLKWFRLPPWS